MITYMSSPQLKASARSVLRPVAGTVAAATMLYIGFTIILNVTLSSLPIETASWQGYALIFILEWFISVLTGMLGAGYQCLFLKLYCRYPIVSEDILFVFKHRPLKAAALSSLMGAISVIPMIPVTVFAERYAVSQSSTDIMIVFFCLTPAVIITTLADLFYSQIYYLMLDFPSYTVKDLFRRSRLLMRGHKGRLFYITVSFIPLLLLGGLTCGIGLLWAIPYMQAVKTEFYLDLISKKQYT